MQSCLRVSNDIRLHVLYKNYLRFPPFELPLPFWCPNFFEDCFSLKIINEVISSVGHYETITRGTGSLCDILIHIPTMSNFHLSARTKWSKQSQIRYTCSSVRFSSFQVASGPSWAAFNTNRTSAENENKTQSAQFRCIAGLRPCPFGSLPMPSPATREGPVK